uniref:Uncharacterized protein n=1 Tax=Oryza punctata TaxID=4537 RepID=A0A0E0JVX5_ORYPU
MCRTRTLGKLKKHVLIVTSNISPKTIHNPHAWYSAQSSTSKILSHIDLSRAQVRNVELKLVTRSSSECVIDSSRKESTVAGAEKERTRRRGGPTREPLSPSSSSCRRRVVELPPRAIELGSSGVWELRCAGREGERQRGGKAATVVVEGELPRAGSGRAVTASAASPSGRCRREGHADVPDLPRAPRHPSMHAVPSSSLL